LASFSKKPQHAEIIRHIRLNGSTSNLNESLEGPVVVRLPPLALLLTLTLATPLALPLPATAETVVAGWTHGADGVDGGTGLPGGDGQDGGAATAVAKATFEANTAEATGGSGGDGGRGGNAAPGSSNDGASGGDGGRGGDAFAEATTIGHNFVRAEATGGRRGQPGLGGGGSPPGTSGEQGQYGIGGDATAIASVEQSYEAGSTALGLDGQAIAEAGVFGEAHATIVGRATGVGSDDQIHVLKASAGPTSYPSTPQTLTHAEASGSTTHGSLMVEASSAAFHGGDATAIASGSHSGTGELIVSATADVWDFHEGFNSGQGVAEARGVSTGGADVTVSANLHGGRDSELRNAVGGSTSGQLNLRQTLGGFQDFPANRTSPATGVIRSELSTENAGGGGLDILVRANSSQTLPDQGDGYVVFGDIVGTSTSGADVNIEVLGIGRSVRQENLDDSSQSSQIRGVSNGGDVSVSANFRNSSFDFSDSDGSTTIGQSGLMLSMDNAVTGDTTGNLALEQHGSGDYGSSVNAAYTGAQPPPGPIAGAGGDVFNRLTKSGAFESLAMNATSLAGNGGSVQSRTVPGPAGVGGDATTIIDATNMSGAVEIKGNARAGIGGESYTAPGLGGHARLDLRATTFGDGNSIVIGNEEPVEFRTFPRVYHGAYGGLGGSIPRTATDPSPPPQGPVDGGRAESRSEGYAHGDSQVEVWDHARGGTGGLGAAFPYQNPDGTGARGGDASSNAVARGGGTSSVLAQSRAIGGGGSAFVTMGGEGGDANALALAEGLGETRSTAIAVGGLVRLRGTIAGSGHAVAEVAAAQGTAVADAQTGAGSGAIYRAMISRSTTTRTRLEAIATYSESLPSIDRANSGTAFITGSPLAGDIVDARGRHHGLDTLLGETPGAKVEAVGHWSAGADKRSVPTQFVELDITLDTPESEGELALAIFKVDATSGGFQSLAFRLEVLGEAFGEEAVFTNLAEANAYFSSLILLGEAFDDQFNGRGSPAVRAFFEVTTRERQSVAFGLAAVVIPEPSTALLLGIGLASLARRRATPNRRMH
jgi:hypothetical protein